MPIEGETMSCCQAGLVDARTGQAGKTLHGGKIYLRMLLVSAIAIMTALPVQSRSQSSFSSQDPSAPVTVPGTLAVNYVRPTQRTTVNNYIFDAFGPYPFAAVGVAAGINQWSDTPPEWGEGVNGYGKRFGSDFATATIVTTTRYGLAQAFREDTLYYRCECAGPFPRLRHAVVSTLTGRRGEDGHRVFSFSALAAPYAGSMTAVYGWYPNRFGAKDAFRMGNYNLLGYMGGNIALEFFYSGPHAVISRMHLNNTHGAPDPGPNH
jgi:hypothetical protein